MRALVLFMVMFMRHVRTDDCQYSTPDGVFDLRVFGYPDRPKYSGIADSIPEKKLSYSYNGCFSYKTKGDCRNAAACMTDLVSGTSKVIARQAGRTFTYNTELAQLVYTDGASITLRVFLICSGNESIKAKETDKNNYFLSIEGPCACPGKCTYKPPAAISGGGIFLLVLVCLIVSYLLVGVLILRCVKHQQGIDMIPHRTFWMHVPSDALGGVRFTWAKVTRRKNVYESV